MDGYLKQFKKVKRDMLRKGVKIYLHIFFAFFILGCDNLNNNSKKNICIDYVNQNYINYEKEHRLLNDSITNYVDSTLKSFLGEYLWEWQIDSLICLNTKQDKLVTTINISSGSCTKCVSDEIIKILGKKINDKWFFFEGGGTLIVPRDMYGKDAMHPLSFHELSQIARENSLASALIKDENGNYIVNDAWVEKHFYNNGYGNFSNRAAYDSVHWKIILDKWKHKIDTNEYKPLRKNIVHNSTL